MNQPPVYVPDEHRAEIEKLSKAALMDMVWDYAMQFAGVTDYVFDAEEGKAIAEFRNRREIILALRARQPELEKEAAEQALKMVNEAAGRARRVRGSVAAPVRRNNRKDHTMKTWKDGGDPAATPLRHCVNKIGDWAMSTVIETTVYQFDELKDNAKEKAREWFREGSSDDDYDCTIEDAARVADILGIDLRTRAVNLYGGGTRQEPCIYWSGFWSQGDGACFEGTYSYKKGSAKAIRKYAPTDSELHRIADELKETQRKHRYAITASMVHRGHYQHSGCMVVDVNALELEHDFGNVENTVTQLMRDFADWIYKQLQTEWEWRNSDEVVDDNIRANEYTFTADGRRFG